MVRGWVVSILFLAHFSLTGFADDTWRMCNEAIEKVAATTFTNYFGRMAWHNPSYKSWLPWIKHLQLEKTGKELGDAEAAQYLQEMINNSKANPMKGSIMDKWKENVSIVNLLNHNNYSKQMAETKQYFMDLMKAHGIAPETRDKMLKEFERDVEGIVGIQMALSCGNQSAPNLPGMYDSAQTAKKTNFQGGKTMAEHNLEEAMKPITFHLKDAGARVFQYYLITQRSELNGMKPDLWTPAFQ